ncbi:MAG: hypothetical protein FJ247_00935 [Nitrospira sp.]|nr:hypothetical protein [Nitrospira sp.]
MNRTLIGTGLFSLACLLGTAGCALQGAVVQPTSGDSSVSATADETQETTLKVFSDSLEGCLARIQGSDSEGAKWVAEQSCHDNEGLRLAVVGAAIRKSGDRASAGTQGDSLDVCMARIPKDATEGQRLLAEESCQRDQSAHR